MDDTERKRWRKNAKKAEEFLVGLLGDPDVSYVQRLKAADIILARYYGRPALGDPQEQGPHPVTITFEGDDDFAR